MTQDSFLSRFRLRKVSLYCKRMLFKRDAKQDSVNHARTKRIFLFFTLACQLYDRGPHDICRPTRQTKYVTDSQLHADLVR